MSKLKLNKTISSFLNRNKVRLAAIGTTMIIATAIPSCTYVETNSSISQNKDLTKHQQDLKDHILSYITNMEVFKDEEKKCYYIHETLYEDTPSFVRDYTGEIIEREKTYIGYSQFIITFKEAELMELTKVLGEETKTK